MGTYKLVPQMRRSGNHCGTDRHDDYCKVLRLVKVIYHLAKFAGNSKNIRILSNRNSGGRDVIFLVCHVIWLYVWESLIESHHHRHFGSGYMKHSRKYGWFTEMWDIRYSICLLTFAIIILSKANTCSTRILYNKLKNNFYGNLRYQVTVTHLVTFLKNFSIVCPKNWTGRKKRRKKLEQQLQRFCVIRKRDKLIIPKYQLILLEKNHNDKNVAVS